MTGVILMTYGSATTADHVREYFERIYKGKASEGLIEDFENRYRLVGRSPLVEISAEQAAGLERLLGEGYAVRSGMRHSDPFILDAVGECRHAGATSLIGVILAPQCTSFIKEGYRAAFVEAAVKHGYAESEIRLAAPWPIEPHFIALLAQRVREAQATLQAEFGTEVPVIFTTHSLPKRVVEHDARYLEQLQQTIDAVRAQLDGSLEWYAAYQSAGHTPEEWLTPDLHDVLRTLSEEEKPGVLIVPIQFLSDHLEILYDLDIAARKQCEDLGIAYHRIGLPNVEPLFMEALKGVVKGAERVDISSDSHD